MPRGHALNPEQKSEKCRLAALGNTNRLGQHWKWPPERIARGCNNWFKKGVVNYPNKKVQNWVRENNPNWTIDRTKLVKNEKKHLDGRYREWMFSVKNRDGWKCRIINNDCKGRLESHHILSWKEYPELRYDINNGITLCHAHHPRGRENEAKLSPYFLKLVAEMQ